MTWMGLTRLQILMLDHNLLSELEYGNFEPIRSTILRLYLHNNELKFLDHGLFTGMTRLSELFLQNNLLNSISDSAFGLRSNYPAIYLTGNSLACGKHMCNIMAEEKQHLRECKSKLDKYKLISPCKLPKYFRCTETSFAYFPPYEADCSDMDGVWKSISNDMKMKCEN